jgi:hypothetical protein
VAGGQPSGAAPTFTISTIETRVGAELFLWFVQKRFVLVFLDFVCCVFDLRRHPERACFSATRDPLLFFFLAGGGWPSLGRGTSVHHLHD